MENKLTILECGDCGAKLEIKRGKYGFYYGCPNKCQKGISAKKLIAIEERIRERLGSYIVVEDTMLITVTHETEDCVWLKIENLDEE